MSFLFIVTIPSGVRLKRSGVVQEVNDTIHYGIAKQEPSDRNHAKSLGLKSVGSTNEDSTSVIKPRDSKGESKNLLSVVLSHDDTESLEFAETSRHSALGEIFPETSRKSTSGGAWQSENAQTGRNLNGQSGLKGERKLAESRVQGVKQVEANMQGLFAPTAKERTGSALDSINPSRPSSKHILSQLSKGMQANHDKMADDASEYITLDVAELLADVLETDLLLTPTWVQDMKGKKIVVQFPCDANKVELVIAKLLGIGVGSDYGTVQVVPIEISRPVAMSSVADDGSNNNKAKFMESVRSRLVMEKVLAQVEVAAALTFDYISLVIIAAVVAGVGLAANSVVAVVASMLISPIMGPILAFTFGTMILDWDMVRHGLKMELLSLLLCMIVGFIIGAICTPLANDENFNWPNNEMISRGKWESCIISLGIAIPSGAGVALSILGNNTPSLVGVAISASLLPPAVNAGLLYAYAIFGPLYGVEMKMSAHDLAVAGTYSFLLTIVNIICIYLMGLLMFKIKEVAPIPGKTDFWKSAVHAQRLHPRGKGYGNHGLPMDIRSSAELDVEAQSQGTYHTQYQSTLRNNNTYQGAVPDEVYGTGFGALMAYRPPVHEQSHLNQLNNQFTLTQRTLNALNNSTMQRGGAPGIGNHLLKETAEEHQHPSVQHVWKANHSIV